MCKRVLNQNENSFFGPKDWKAKRMNNRGLSEAIPPDLGQPTYTLPMSLGLYELGRTVVSRLFRRISLRMQQPRVSGFALYPGYCLGQASAS